MSKPEAATTQAQPKKPKHRSPNHPVVDLGKAIELADKIQKKYGAHEVPVNLAHETWGYTAWAAIPDQCVAALKSYGLIKVIGSGTARKLVLTDEGDRITRKAPDRDALIRKAAIAPTVHKEVMDHYGSMGLPADDILRQYLVWGRQDGQRFNSDAVDAFIARLRSTLKFANLDSSAIMEKTEEEKDPPATIKIGDFIQWTSGGVDQFFRPMKVADVRDGHVFIEDSQTGIPMAEATVVTPPDAGLAGSTTATPLTSAAPVNATLKMAVFPIKQDVFTVQEGNVLLQWPAALSKDSVGDIEDWLKLIVRKAKRAAGISPEETAAK